jgi:GT2 family glycosyltransferase
MESRDLSIVIVSYNVRDYLKECLSSIPAACAGLSFEIFVVDNASRDDSAAIVAREFPQVHLTVNSENVGMAKAVNQVLPMACGRYTLLLNPDTLMTKEALVRLVAVADRWPEVGVAGPLIRDPANGATLKTLRSFPTWRTAFFLYTVARPFLRRLETQPWEATVDRPTACGQLIGACFLIRRELLKQIGGLDPKYFLYCEDTEYCRRAIDAGWKILYTREAEIFHYQARSTAQEAQDWIWALHLKSLYRYLRTGNAAGAWFYGGIFKALFLSKMLLQMFESMLKIPVYDLMKRSSAAARHRWRCQRNAWVVGELLHRRFFI